MLFSYFKLSKGFLLKNQTPYLTLPSRTWSGPGPSLHSSVISHHSLLFPLHSNCTGLTSPTVTHQVGSCPRDFAVSSLCLFPHQTYSHGVYEHREARDLVMLTVVSPASRIVPDILYRYSVGVEWMVFEWTLQNGVYASINSSIEMFVCLFLYPISIVLLLG